MICMILKMIYIQFDRYNGKDPRMLAADRIVGNFLEQTWAFLISMWIYCLFVNMDIGGILGFVWFGLRVIYIFLMGCELRNFVPYRVVIVTFPCYGIILYYLYHTLIVAIIK